VPQIGCRRRSLGGGRYFALALHANTTVITAIGNDYSYESIYARQVEAHGRAGDVLIGITTSGNSANIVQAAIAARQAGIRVIGLTGAGGGKLREHCDLCLCVPSRSTPRIQEMHILIGHVLCQIAEDDLA
jgi:D-sedoheptulose 7-phosphate isomerase